VRREALVAYTGDAIIVKDPDRLTVAGAWSEQLLKSEDLGDRMSAAYLLRWLAPTKEDARKRLEEY
jgi:hypothetical protein